MTGPALPAGRPSHPHRPDPARAARFRRLRASPALFPGVAERLGPDFPWHPRAAGARSSQALCVSAWAPLADLDERHQIVERLLRSAVGCLGDPGDGRDWRISLEVSRPPVLAERGGDATRVDVLLESPDAVVGIESKYLGDALEGPGRCRQFPYRCRGFHGPGSDLGTGTAAPCRLTVADGRRQARRYWDVAERLFDRRALTYDDEPGSCPLHRFGQLARTLFFAAELARRREAEDGLPAGTVSFAALVMAPAATAAGLERRVAAFRAGVLTPRVAGRVAMVHYERLADLLLAGSPDAARVGRFLSAKLQAARPAAPDSPPPAGPPRTQTVRELARRARQARPQPGRPKGRPPSGSARPT